MVDHDLRLGFRALNAGLIGPDQLLEAIAERLALGGRPLREILEARGWASPDQLDDLEVNPGTDSDLSTTDDPTAPFTPGRNGKETTRLDLADPSDSTAPFGEPTTRFQTRWASRSRSADEFPSGGRYQRLRVHALGGLGRVWLALDLHLGREVALKELRIDRSVDPGLVARFIEEARITSRLEHPGIVPLYDLVEEEGEDGLPFYTMRFLAGRTLSVAVETYHRKRLEGAATPLEFRGLLDAFTAVCQAVAFAHSKDVLHRDLKGSNVVLGHYGEVFVIDWGLAKSAKPGREQGSSSFGFGSGSGVRDETEPGSVLGTPGYIAPELLEGWPADRLSDVYGLGAILYLILTGQSAYAGGTRREMLRTLQEREPENPRSLVADTPRGLESICLQAMARDPSERYGSASELAEEVRRWLADEPVRAYPDPLAQRLTRWARKHRSAVVAASLALVSAVVVLAVATALIWRSWQETAEQRTVAVNQRYQADMNLILARQLTVDMLIINDGRLAVIPGAERARAELFDSHLATFRNNLRQKPTDQHLRFWTARTGRYSANTHQLMNELKVAEPTYRESIALHESLAGEYPHDPTYGSEQALALVDYARGVAKLGRLPEAAGLAGRAIEVAESQVLRFPGQSGPLRALAVSLGELASIEGRMGRPGDSARASGNASRIFDQLLKNPPGAVTLGDRLMLASALLDQAAARRDLGQGSDGLATLDRGIELMRSILEKDPEQVNASHLLASLQLERARGAADFGESRESAGLDLDRAITIWDELAKAFRHFPFYKEAGAEARLVRGASREDSGLVADDLEASRQALESLANAFPEIPDYRAGLGRSYHEQGRLALRLGQTGPAIDRLDLAVRTLRGATLSAPEDARTRNWLAEAEAERSGLRDGKAGPKP